MEFQGYRREDGKVGVRNHVLVLSSVSCANGVVEDVGRALPEVVSVT
ncbi:MAG: UxaA family hydrolase, partial [Candidatus Abyssubacteria bacterium]|nr:UxaA family hydrolase [Candidatus Abyssubacteria bacterium]